MTTSALKTLSHDLHALADEATDHLKEAAEKTGSEAADAIARSTHAISRAADRLRDEADTSIARAGGKLSDAARDHPAAAGLVTSVVTSALVALAATFALIRLSQS